MHPSVLLQPRILILIRLIISIGFVFLEHNLPHNALIEEIDDKATGR